MIDALYNAFTPIFWAVMTWGMISAHIQRCEALKRLVWLNIAGQIAGLVILHVEAEYGVYVQRWLYYTAQFAIMGIVMTPWPPLRPQSAARLGVMAAGASVAGIAWAVTYRISGASDPLLLFNGMMFVSIVLLILVAGASSGRTGARVVSHLWGLLDRFRRKASDASVAG